MNKQESLAGMNDCLDEEGVLKNARIPEAKKFMDEVIQTAYPTTADPYDWENSLIGRED